MKRTYKLEGLDCANCAAHLERKLQQIEGLDSASVNFMTLKCVIEAADDKIETVVEKALAIIAKEEPDVEVRRA